MNHPSPELVRATMRQREESARRVFAAGRSKGGETVIRYRCGWCGVWLQGEPEGRYVESTGMCGPCSDDLKREAGGL